MLTSARWRSCFRGSFNSPISLNSYLTALVNNLFSRWYISAAYPWWLLLLLWWSNRAWYGLSTILEKTRWFLGFLFIGSLLLGSALSLSFFLALALVSWLVSGFKCFSVHPHIRKKLPSLMSFLPWRSASRTSPPPVFCAMQIVYFYPYSFY